MNKINKLLYIITFIALYVGTALVSTLHAVEFFSVSNVAWIAVLLAVCFEIGQAAVLFSILTTKANRKKFMPWALMGILTTVQIIGNVFASYKYIMMHSVAELKYFKEPIFIWTNLPDNQSTVIMTYISASILPIVALALTAMITSFLDVEPEDNINNEKTPEEIQSEKVPEVPEIHEKTPDSDDIVDDASAGFEAPEDKPSQMITDKDSAVSSAVSSAASPQMITDAAPSPVDAVEQPEANTSAQPKQDNMKKSHLVTV